MSDSCPFSLPHPLDREFVENPYPFLSAAREQAPVCRIEELDLWLVTRYQDIKKILHDGRYVLERQRPAASLPAV